MTSGGSPSPKADLYGAVFWMVLGAAIVTGAWTMDRLERFQVKPYEAPGLVPGLLGVLIVFLGVVLLIRAVHSRRLAGASGATAVQDAQNEAAAHDSEGPSTGAPGSITLGLSLSLIYALVLVGRGLPFWLATFVYVTAFVTLLDGDRQVQLGRGRRTVLVRAAVYGAIVSLAVTVVFQSIFLVRLP